METVIQGLMNSSSRGLKRQSLLLPFTCPILATSHPVPDLISPPDLTQARVNKCLIALVNRKIVVKDNSSVCYHNVMPNHDN
jgi:DASH complex subunit DAM1